MQDIPAAKRNLPMGADTTLSLRELRHRSFQQNSMTATNSRAVSHDKSGFGGGFQFRIPLRGLHVGQIGSANRMEPTGSKRERVRRRK
jgi:hypothetical protein